MGEPNNSSGTLPAAHNRCDVSSSQVVSPQSQLISPPLQRSRWEFQPPSEYSMSTEDRALTSRPQDASATEEYSEGRWLKWDSDELRRRREMTTQQTPPLQHQRPENAAEPPQGAVARTPYAWFGDRGSAFDLFASSLSSSTEDKPSQRSVDEPSPQAKAPDKVPGRPPSAAMPWSQLIAAGNAEPAGERQQEEIVQHGTEESHLPYWTARAKCAGAVSECPLKPGPMPAQLQVFDTESAREESGSHGSSAAVVGEGLETGAEISTTKGTGGEDSVEPHAEPDDGKHGVASRRRSRQGEPTAESLEAAPAAKDAAAIPPKPLTAAPTAATTSAKPPATELPATKASATKPSDANLAAGRSHATTGARSAAASGAAALTAGQAVAGQSKETVGHQTPATATSQPFVVSSPTEIRTQASSKRLQRTQLPKNEKPRDGGTDHNEAGAVPKAGDQLRSCYVNEPEYHHYVTAVLQRIPMRLLLLDMALAFLFVIFSHMRILSLRESAWLTNATLQSPAFVYRRPVCRDPACGSAGLNLYYTLNESADACRSIFDKVCHPWVHEPPSKYHRVLVGSERLVTAEVLREVGDFLETQLSQVWPSTSRGKLALLYASCRDHESRDRAGLEYFRSLLRRYEVDRWPFREGDTALSKPQRVLELFTRDTGAEPYFSLRLRKSGDTFVFTVGCPLLGLPPLSFIEKTADVGVYLAYIDSVQKMIAGFYTNRSDVPANVVAFETGLARAQVQSCNDDDGAYKRKTLRDLAGTKWDWERFLDEVTQGAARNYPHLQSASWEYAANVTATIVGDSVPAANYFGWKVVSRLAPYTTTSMANAYKQFLQATGLETHQPSRHCLTQVNQVLPFAMGRVYALKSPRTSTNYEAYRVAYHVARSLDIYIVKNHRPLDPEVEGVYRKLRSTMDLTIGYPEWAADEARLDAYYEPVRIGGSYLESHVSAARVTYQRSFDPARSMWGRERLMFPEDPERWTFDPAWHSVYDIQDNRFYVLPAVLQPPYYVEGTVPSLNYGGLGFLLATAVLTELFSKNAEQAASSTDGNFLARSLRTVRARLVAAAARWGGAHNGSRTDALAARVAYLSYHMHDDFRDAPTVQGLETTAPDQLFFIGVARTLCTLARSRHYTRVVGQRTLVTALTAIDDALLPLPEYRDAFNCNVSDMHR
ncbi:hypothetical protein HPB52_013561 [Rhipicephalus sanguineus]|uniref:Uncharacterized protein n=1 Tax=Rhipicephalus sanguineus TaxID=34632 RepID=A0A9D4PXF0_RHISA|nr:hypothetical protein HPB52_013561 [Rhipicephalus sanguineus]